MIILDVEQGSEEWFSARQGIPTASNYDAIITSTGKPSTQAKTYRNKLLAELLGAITVGPEKNEWMQRGNDLEPDARNLFEFEKSIDVQQVGMCFQNEERRFSCSPDGLIGDDSGLEIKCPAPHTHIEYLLGGKLPSKYVAQVQGSMWVTGRSNWWFMSYHPDLPSLIINVKRDDKFITTLAELMDKFLDDFDKQKEKLMKYAA